MTMRHIYFSHEDVEFFFLYALTFCGMLCSKTTMPERRNLREVSCGAYGEGNVITNVGKCVHDEMKQAKLLKQSDGRKKHEETTN